MKSLIVQSRGRVGGGWVVKSMMVHEVRLNPIETPFPFVSVTANCLVYIGK